MAKLTAHQRWADGRKIGKKPREMSDGELDKFTSQSVILIVQRIKTLRPYLMEVRRRFHRLARGEKFCGFPTWDAYCQQRFGRTKRALNYMLAGGNKNRPQVPEVLPKQNLLAGDEDAPAERMMLEPEPLHPAQVCART